MTMQIKSSFALTVAISFMLALGAGCSKYQPKAVDITKGEYYEDTEYNKLSEKDKAAYCKALSEELARLTERSQTAEAQLGKNKDKIKVLTKELRDAEKEYSSYSAEIDELTKQIQTLALLPKTWKLQYGECLWTLAAKEEIYKDPLKWPRIWRGNEQLIEDPDWVLAGWTINIPRDWPTEHVVSRDEWLGKIAGYWEVYGDYKKWPILYEANKDQIDDPNLIYVKEKLVVPRPDSLAQ
jgi:nucleoid-associated protein YgaU